MRFEFVSNSSYGRGIPQFELHKNGCRDIDPRKVKAGEVFLIEVDTIDEALDDILHNFLSDVEGYTKDDIKIFNCAKGGRAMSDAKKEVKQNLKSKMSDAERKAMIDAKVKEKAEAKKNGVTEPKQDKVDKALNDAMVSKKAPTDPPDPNLLSVSDVAKELGMEPKAARAKLRRAKGKAQDGRWPKVTRDSQEHKDLVALLKTEEAKKEKTNE